jgi:hypothetical protein
MPDQEGDDVHVSLGVAVDYSFEVLKYRCNAFPFAD